MFELENFEKAVDRLYSLLKRTDESIVGIQLSDDAWSLKEIVGHLIDSASNNHQRFVRLQGGSLEGFPTYDGERWIKIQKYNHMNWSLLKDLCMNFNRLILRVVESIPEECLGNTWSLEGNTFTLEWLVNDYYRHLKSHIEHFQIRTAEINE
ncbi:MAG: hypothetical protein JSV89_04950 [Spirochaetaceae bacterium]|nr:MAG: hypothetical protein JSV89_04950 [Spirochaetaceae bacterium]